MRAPEPSPSHPTAQSIGNHDPFARRSCVWVPALKNIDVIKTKKSRRARARISEGTAGYAPAQLLLREGEREHFYLARKRWCARAYHCGHGRTDAGRWRRGRKKEERKMVKKRAVKERPPPINIILYARRPSSSSSTTSPPRTAVFERAAFVLSRRPRRGRLYLPVRSFCRAPHKVVSILSSVPSLVIRADALPGHSCAATSERVHATLSVARRPPPTSSSSSPSSFSFLSPSPRQRRHGTVQRPTPPRQ